MNFSTFLIFEFFILLEAQITNVPIQFKTGLIKFLKRKYFYYSEEGSTVPSTTLSTTTSTTVSIIFSTSLPSLISMTAVMDLQTGSKHRIRPRKCQRPQPGEIPFYDSRCHGPPIHPPNSKNFLPENPDAIPNNFKCGSIRQIFTFPSFDFKSLKCQLLINLKLNLSVHPKGYEVTNHYKKGYCIGCSGFLDRFHSNSSGKILFGDKTEREEIPWHVSIHDSRNIFNGCGGTLISPSKILSAAHCFGKNPEIWGQLSTGPEYKYKAIVGNTKVGFQIDDRVFHLIDFICPVST